MRERPPSLDQIWCFTAINHGEPGVQGAVSCGTLQSWVHWGRVGLEKHEAATNARTVRFCFYFYWMTLPQCISSASAFSSKNGRVLSSQVNGSFHGERHPIISCFSRIICKNRIEENMNSSTLRGRKESIQKGVTYDYHPTSWDTKLTTDDTMTGKAPCMPPILDKALNPYAPDTGHRASLEEDQSPIRAHTWAGWILCILSYFI